MAWGRMDDAFDEHPKVLALLDMEGAAAAVGLWTLCWTWAHRNTRKKGRIPGLIPASLPRRFFGPAAREMAALLVEVGLWDELDADGWMIHDFADYLPGKELSQKRSEAGKRGAAKRWGDRENASDKRLTQESVEPDGEPEAERWQDDGKLPSNDGLEPSDGSKAVASDGSRAGAHRVWVEVSSLASDRTSVSLRQDQPQPPAAAASGDGEGVVDLVGEEILEGEIVDFAAAKQAKTPALGSDQDPGFVEFWQAYPRKVGKPSARRAWVKAVGKARASPEAIIAAARRFAADPRRRSRDIEFTAHPATWLNDARYDDAPQEQEQIGWDDIEEQAPREFNW